MKKEYLLTIRSKRGAVVSVGAFTDTTSKPFRIYHNGIDTGLRYEKAGNASRYLEQLSAIWGEDCEKEYKPLSAIHVIGCSEWNKALFRHWYLHEPFPNPKAYYPSL